MLLLRLRHVTRGVAAGHIGAKVLPSAARCCGSHRRQHLSNVAAVLESRAVIEISGADAKALLQGLMTNDMSLLDKDKLPCISAAFLNAKGRVVGDALVIRSPRHDAKNKPGYLLDCPVSVAEGLKRHLQVYKLRSKVKIKDATSAYDVVVSGIHDPWQRSSETDGGVVASAGHAVARFTDPRCDALGVRLLRSKGGTAADSDGTSWAGGDEIVSEDRYHAVRMINGVAEGAELVDSIPLESNLDLLGSISFTKGCYVGQELTARTQFKGFVRKRILPVLFPREGVSFSPSPIKTVPSVFSDAREVEELLQSTWGSGVAPPAAGSTVVDCAAGDGKLGILVAVSPAYNVGLALLRLGKIMSPISPHGSAEPLTPGGNVEDVGPAADCRVVDGSVEGKEPRRRCLPLTAPWWPVDLDPTTGKVSA